MSSSSSSSAEYKKALKTLEGEQRAALKKAKALKGPKGKEAVTRLEEEFAQRTRDLWNQYHPNPTSTTTTTTTTTSAEATPTEATATVAADAPPTVGGVDDKNNNDHEEEDEERQRKLLKIQRKKEKQRQKEKERQLELEQAHAEAMAGPNPKQIEWDQIQQQLQPLQLKVQQVEADGHCLYRAVGAQTGRTYLEIRSLCADTLAAHPDDFAPFCEYPNDDNLNDHNDNDPYQTYVSNVRTSAEWGGHLELRALAVALHRPILIYQAHTKDPLEITPGSGGDGTPAAVGDEPIRLSYHRHYYALGEHYNQVVVESEEDEAEQEEEQPQS